MAADLKGRIDELKQSINEEMTRVTDITQLQLKAEEDLLYTQLNNIKKINEEKIKSYKLDEKRYGVQKAESLAKLKEIDAEVKRKIAANDKISKAEIKNIKAKAEAEKKALLAKDKEIAKIYNSQIRLQKLLDHEAAVKNAHAAGRDLMSGVFGKGNGIGQRVSAIKSAFTNENGVTNIGNGVSTLVAGLADFVASLNKDIDSIASKKSIIDTAMQGSRHSTGGLFGIGSSYWDNMSKNITGITGVSPLVRQKDVLNNLENLVKSGINFNVEQRAFLATISDKIAATFNVSDATMLRLIRLQQEDSTAARLGMESSMTAFLNNMYETSEYMRDLASGIRNSLAEAEALMTTSQAVAFEYQVQKWSGSMYSVGMSSNAVSNIASTVGKLAAGDISGLTNGGTGNLILMAANAAGLSVASMLKNGLDDSETNKLMNSVVDYLGKLYNNSRDSKVIQQQLASVYGITASDLRAAGNLSGSLADIRGSNLSYGGAIGRLNSMANSMYSRTSLGELLTNSMDNLQYTLTSGIANNPALYSIFKLGTMLKDVAGGIAIPAISAMGSGVDLETTVADLMLVGALGGGILSGLGNVVGGLFSGSAGGFSGSGMLKALGVGKSNIVTRGNAGSPITISGNDVSTSGYIGNGSGDDVYNATMSSANDSKNAQMASAQEENTEVSNKVIDEHIIKIYDLLDSVVNGTASFNVKNVNYGLTGWL